jgi:hypothetical protein
MGVSWGILAPFFAIVITLGVMQAAVVLTDAIRTRDYRLFRDKSRDSITRQFLLPAVDPSPAEDRRKSLSPFVDKSHQAAGAAQTTYHNAVVRSAGCLVLAFLALAFGTLHSEEWPLKVLRWPSVELVLSWLDATALFSVLMLFFYGRIVRRPWMAARTGTELLRQYQILSFVFPSVISGGSNDELETQFDIETSQIAARVQKGPINGIAERIQRFWSSRRASIEHCIPTTVDLTADALLVYLERRARRQLAWFTDSKARLECIAERRSVVLISLYCIAVGLAIIKLVLFIYNDYAPFYLLRLLLIVTGMSAAMTAYYINQNSRSLIHRYNTQQRIITGWLVAFNDRWPFENLPKLTIDLAAKNDIRAQILRFEDLMIEELIDWIHITSHDSIELA